MARIKTKIKSKNILIKNPVVSYTVWMRNYFFTPHPTLSLKGRENIK